MAILSFNQIKDHALLYIGQQLLLAAKTAPKGRGIDLMDINLITGEDLRIISEEMINISEEKQQHFFSRDAKNIMKASAIIIFSTKIKPLGLQFCGMCGFKNCSEKEKYLSVPCVFNTIDLGIAMGSVVSKAAEMGVDNRIMYTIGQAVIRLKILKDNPEIVFGIPIAAEAKNPFFDRA